MTRILVQRGSSGGGSSSNQNLSRSPAPVAKDEECGEEVPGGQVAVGDEILEFAGSSDCNKAKSDEVLMESLDLEPNESTPLGDDEVTDAGGKDVKEDVADGQELARGLSGERTVLENEGLVGDSPIVAGGSSHPPPPPVPPPKPSATNLNSRRNVSGTSNVGSPRRASQWPVVSARTSPAGSRPSSPRAHNESEGYNSADEQKPCFVSSYDDFVS